MMNVELADLAGLYDEFFLLDEPALKQPVIPAEKPVIIENEKPKSFRFQGANKRHILFIYNDKNQKAGADMEMLTNLVTKALNFSMDDIVLLKTSENEEFTPAEILQQFASTHVIAWGYTNWLQQHGMQHALHTQAEAHGAQWLNADAVSTYHENKDHKVQLWASIQQLLKS